MNKKVCDEPPTSFSKESLQSVLPEILQTAVESYLLLSLASILLWSENPSKEWSENKQHSSFCLCHLWKIYLDDDHAKARKEADHCWDTTVFAALANVKKKIIIFFTFEMSKFILGSILQKMNERRGKMDANFAWVISRFQPPFNIALPLILI